MCKCENAREMCTFSHLHISQAFSHLHIRTFLKTAAFAEKVYKMYTLFAKAFFVLYLCTVKQKEALFFRLMS